MPYTVANATPDMEFVRAFYHGALSVGFYAAGHGAVFAICESDTAGRKLVFRHVGKKRAKVYCEFPIPEHKAADYLSLLLFIKGPH